VKPVPENIHAPIDIAQINLYMQLIMKPFVYDRSQSLGHLTNVVARSLNSRLGKRFAQAGIDLTSEQWGAMLLLWNQDGRKQQEIAQGLALEKSTVSRLLNGLEKHGLAVRTQDPDDSRQKLIILTDKGREIRDESVQIARTLLAETQSGITDTELFLCRDVLGRMLRNLK
jgi:DNA-binding MarR family transcriptional regulator